ncbi:hypothetical protein K1719_008596 [Acacia pycnantha]|nr:hypothetical protein K1719_008596 [Acacia pycnantha]
MRRLMISSSKHPQEINVNLGTAQASGSEVVNDLNSAKVAAMKAAELVNKNLVGTGAGCLTTDQKKKLLWDKASNWKRLSLRRRYCKLHVVMKNVSIATIVLLQLLTFTEPASVPMKLP